MPVSAEAAAEPALTSAVIQDFAAFKAEMDTVVLTQPPPSLRSASVMSSTSGPLSSEFKFDDDDDDDDDEMEVETSPPRALSIADMQQLDPPPHSVDVEPRLVTELAPSPLVLDKGACNETNEEVVSPRRGAWDWSVGGEILGGWNALVEVETERGVVVERSRDVEMVL